MGMIKIYTDEDGNLLLKHSDVWNMINEKIVEINEIEADQGFRVPDHANICLTLLSTLRDQLTEIKKGFELSKESN